MGRSPHERHHIDIDELGGAATTHVFELGEFVCHESDFDHYNGRIIVHCITCDREWRYANITRAPQWVQRLYQKAMAHEV